WFMILMNKDSTRSKGKSALKLVLSVAAFALIFSCTSLTKSVIESAVIDDVEFDCLRSTFWISPDSIQTSVFWFWVSDNISKDGVIRDLHAMKRAGINRAFIGNLGLSNVEYGSVKMFSDEWWDILHTALKTAGQLDIEIGIFNSPGWSQAGGPWVKPEQAMRYLAAADTLVSGPLAFNGVLPAPQRDFQRVNVLAFRVPMQIYRFGPLIGCPIISLLKGIV